MPEQLITYTTEELAEGNATEPAGRLQLCTLWQICCPMMSQSVLASTMLTSCCAWQ